MSRFLLNLNYQAPARQAQLGFDEPLQEFFLEVFENGEPLYTSLADNAEKHSLWFARRLADFEVVLPQDVYETLMLGAMGLLRAMNAGNQIGEQTVPSLSPLQQQLVKMKAVQRLPTCLSFGAPVKIQWVLSPQEKPGLPDWCHVPFESETVLVYLPSFLVPDAGKDGQDSLSDAELLALLQATAAQWEDYKPTSWPEDVEAAELHGDPDPEVDSDAEWADDDIPLFPED